MSFFLLVLALISLFSIQSISTHNSLRFLIEMTRHGARSPLYDNFTTSQWDCPPGHLTPTGKREHYLLGREMRQRYMIDQNFLSKIYKEEEIKVYSTPYPRTIQSAESQLLGLYYKAGELFNRSKMIKKYVVPHINVKNWKQIINQLKDYSLPSRFQPIEVETNFPQSGAILLPSDSCKKISTIFLENQQTEYHMNFELKLHAMGFYKQFEEIFKVNASNFTIEQTQEYLDIITMNMYDNRPLPENYTKEFNELMNFAYCFRQYYFGVGNDSVIPLYVSGFYQNLITVLDNKIADPKNPLKMNIFSAHDNNIIYLLMSLGMANYTDDYEEFKHPTKYFTYENPPLASLLLFELHEIDNNYYIRILYNDEEMVIKGCDKYCNYEKFKQIVSKLILNDWDEQCENINK